MTCLVAIFSAIAITAAIVGGFWLLLSLACNPTITSLADCRIVEIVKDTTYYVQGRCWNGWRTVSHDDGYYTFSSINAAKAKLDEWIAEAQAKDGARGVVWKGDGS